MNRKDPTELQEFVICECASNFVFGCTWCVLSENSVKKYRSALLRFREELGNKIRMFEHNGKMLVDFAPDVFIRIWREISQMGIANLNIDEDMALFNKNREIASQQFAKHLKKVMGRGNSFTEQLGLFCVNETDRVQFKNPLRNGESSIVPAYRITLDDAKQIAMKLGIQATIAFQTIASSSTAVIVMAQYKR